MAIMPLVIKQIRQDGPNLGPSFTMGLFLDPHPCHLLAKFHPKKKKTKKKKEKKTYFKCIELIVD
jgi:hypothetical protein